MEVQERKAEYMDEDAGKYKTIITLEEQLKELLVRVTGVKPQDLKPEANFWTDLGIDSIKAIEITVSIEKQFNIRIRDEQIPIISNFNQMVEVVKAALAKKQP